MQIQETCHADLPHADIVIQSIDDIDLSFDVIQPDLHCQTFGILRRKKIDPPDRNKKSGYQRE
jgi:hypothetical protein